MDGNSWLDRWGLALVALLGIGYIALVALWHPGR
jgi:hypothetical protein